MHQTQPTVDIVSVLRNFFLTLGFILFLVLGVATLMTMSKQHGFQDSGNLQPELQETSAFLK